MIRPILFLIILFFPFVIIALHKNYQNKKNPKNNEKWNYLYTLFLCLYVLFILYTAEVF